MSLGPLGFGPLPSIQDQQSTPMSPWDLARLFNPRRLDGTGASLTPDGTADLPAGAAEHVNAGGDISAMFGGASMGAPQSFAGSATAPMVSSGGFRPHRYDAPADGNDPFPPPRPSAADLGPLSLGPIPGASTAHAPTMQPPPADDRGAPVAADFQPAPLPASEQRARMADMPAPGAVPISSQMPPLSFSGTPQPAAPVAPAPSPAASMAPAPAASPKDEGGGFLSNLSRPSVYNNLIGIGTAMMSTKGIGNALAQGVGNASKLNAQQAATDLAQAEYGLKARKLGQADAALNLTRSQLIARGKAPADVDTAIAAAQAGHNEPLNNLLGGLFPKAPEAPSGFTLNPDGTMRRIIGGPQDPSVKREDAQATAEGSAAGKPEDTTADQKNFEEAKKGGYTGSFLDYQVLKANAGKAQTTINNAVNPVLKGLGDQFVESAANARSASDAARAVQTARSQIDAPGGVITGSFANDRLKLQKLGSFLGVADPSSIQNTETFRTQIKPLVLETVKGLGAGSGISNADRDFAAEAVGGNINLDEGTIRRVLDITERAARSKVERHNKLAGQMLETQPELKQIAPMLQVEMPGMATQPALTSQPQGLPQGARQAPDGNWYTPDPSRPGKFLRVQ